VTDVVSIKLEGNTLQDAMLPSSILSCAHIDRFDSDGWVSCDQVIFLMHFVCF